MKLVVVGGHSRNIGKTSVAAGLVAALRGCRWTAVKITQYGHGICSRTSEPCSCTPEDPDCPFDIREERDPKAPSDSSRFLAAGARRSLWVRTRVGKLALAMPALREAIAGEEHVMIESNSVLAFLQPDLYLVVLDPQVQDFKESARAFLDRADAYLVIGDEPVAVEGKPTVPLFRVPRGKYLTPEIVSFVEQRLCLKLLESPKPPRKAARQIP